MDNYGQVYVFVVSNMRNAKLKEVRAEWRSSRFLFGKNKVMAHALGRSTAEEYREGLHQIAEELVGNNVGLLFTNKPRDEVLQWFSEYSENEYARAGDVANETVILKAGPLAQFSHSIEPHLRKLGMPTSLQRGIVTLTKEFSVCKEGAKLTPEQASILKLLGYTMATFSIRVTHAWALDTGFAELAFKE